LTNQSRYLVCPKCGSAQARSGGYQECCKIRLWRKEASHYFV